MRILVVSGETSGERHAAGVIRSIKESLNGREVEWLGSGGPEMAREGVQLFEEVRRLEAIGPWDAVAALGRYLRLYRRLLEEVKKRPPCLALLVDFPEFNLRLAGKLHAAGIPVCYFIGPQIWAWRPNRIEAIRSFVTRMLVIFPFEESFYRQRGVPAHYVGNPTKTSFLREVKAQPDQRKSRPDGPWHVALMPGSRRKEVERILPVQLDAAHFISQRHRCKFLLLRAPSIDPALPHQIHTAWAAKTGAAPLQLEVREGKGLSALGEADCAIIKSGTSTLEAMIREIPFAMVYRLSYPSWVFGSRLVRTKTYCLANLVAGQQVVPEFVQDDAKGDRIGSYICELLQDTGRFREVQMKLHEASISLGDRDAYREAARHVVSMLDEE